MDWWKYVIAVVAALGAGWTLKIAISSRSSRSKRATFVSQKNNHVGGDLVGGDMHKNNRE
ncbi:hypothetical protein [Paraburkholderia humisilvae]|uniref:Uncharacterized protein n=1 Tax=Paraburkholderia humisilvae TaxID=627669 RepID=A0A6J5DM96_9BURK|nr:hypothetical protein [Paraburkholderia humisilvae]CAB3755410.1 hypothetical protein LMG29542_02586 [Paraburkholderia humisilvae]